MEFILSFVTGLCLSASSGFRVFVPLLVVSIAGSCGYINLPESSSWISSSPAMITFAAATVLEVAGFYNPWMDNMLDLITTPMVLFAGIILMSLIITEVNPFLKCAIVILAGGGAAVNIQFLTVKARGLSSFVITNGWGNSIFSTIEFFVSVIIALTAVIVPLVSMILLIVIVYVIRRIVKTADTKRKLLILKS